MCRPYQCGLVSGELAIRHARGFGHRTELIGSETQRHQQSLVEQGLGTDQSYKAEHGQTSV